LPGGGDRRWQRQSLARRAPLRGSLPAGRAASQPVPVEGSPARARRGRIR
jgi:hypothetical protein